MNWLWLMFAVLSFYAGWVAGWATARWYDKHQEETGE
jgi:hypothetical protein